MASLPHVAIVRWPEEAAVVALLRAQGSPRLLLLAPDAAPPDGAAWDEDWIRLPAREDDIRVRTEALRARATTMGERPVVKGDGRLLFNGAWVALSPTEQAIAQELATHFGEVVDIDVLARCVEHAVLSPAAVRVHLTRLRKRLAPRGLAVRVVRGRGYVLDREPEPVAAPSRPAV
jgi:two-component system OmpR family response regulator